MRRRRWYFGSFNVLTTDKEEALDAAMQFHIYSHMWRSWG